MKRCNNCGALLDDDALFCTECGTKVEAPEKVCPNCGGSIEDGQAFCTACGTPINGAASATIIAEEPEIVQQPVANNNQSTQCSSDNIIQVPEKKSNPLIIMMVSMIVIILLAVGVHYLLTHNSDSNDDQAIEQPAFIRLYLAGSVDKYPITMQLNIQGTTVKGQYHYDSQAPDKVLTLEGVKNNDNRLYLDEFDEYGKKCGFFNGSLSNGTFEGEFITEKGKSLYFHVSETN